MTTPHAIYRARSGLDSIAEAILERGRYAVLGTENDDGSSHLAPVMYRVDGDVFLMETSQHTRKARNVASRGRATVLVLDPENNGEAWVSGSGRARLLHGEEAQEAGRRVRSRYLTEQGERELGTFMADHDDAAIAVAVDSWLSWDMSAFYTALDEYGLSLDDAEHWFPAVDA